MPRCVLPAMSVCTDLSVERCVSAFLSAFIVNTLTCHVVLFAWCADGCALVGILIAEHVVGLVGDPINTASSILIVASYRTPTIMLRADRF